MSYVLSYIIETGEEVEHELFAESVEDATAQAHKCVAGGEGLITCIELTDNTGKEIYFVPFF